MNFEDRVEHHDLAEHIRELDEVGLTIVPKHKLGLSDAFFERLRTCILRVARERTGVEFNLETGVAAEFGGPAGKMHQFFVTHMIYEDPVFEQVLTHPVKKTLMEHMLGPRHRLSVSNAWIKWQTPDSWEDPVTTSMHADQGQVPAPWNAHAPHVANMNWLLTDYSKRDGAFCYVPGSHLQGRPPKPGEAVPKAVPVEAPAGSLVMFHGAVWHGAFRKETPGLRLSMHGLHCRPYYIPQQDFKHRLPASLFESSADPDYLRMLMREDEGHLEPMVNGTFKVPRVRPREPSSSIVIETPAT